VLELIPPADTQELRKLWLRKTEYTETLRILDEMYHRFNSNWSFCNTGFFLFTPRDQVKIGWERVEHHLDAKDWVEAARVLVQCMRIVDQDEIRQVGAIYDIRLYLADVHAVRLGFLVSPNPKKAWYPPTNLQKFHTRVIEELHQIIYLKQAAPVANLDTSGQTFYSLHFPLGTRALQAEESLCFFTGLKKALQAFWQDPLQIPSRSPKYDLRTRWWNGI